jgi:UDP-N-acetylmuramoylalanine--D-glutamate ligase
VPDTTGESLLAPGSRVLVTGAGITGRSVSAALETTGVRLTICDDDPKALQKLLVPASVVTTAEARAHIADYALVVTGPGFAPTAPLLAAAAGANVPIWGDIELAWRMDTSGRFGPPRTWLAVTGGAGRTTAASLLQAMLTAAGRRAVQCGSVGNPVLDRLGEPAELLVVELSSFQLHWAPSLRPEAGMALDFAESDLDWHGTPAAAARATAGVLQGRVAVAGLDDPDAADLLGSAAARVRVGFRLGEPQAGELGVRDGALIDDAFGDGVVLAQVSSMTAPGEIGAALGAAALARAVDVPVAAIAGVLGP